LSINEIPISRGKLIMKNYCPLSFMIFLTWLMILKFAKIGNLELMERPI